MKTSYNSGLSEIALGNQKAELVLKNASVINVFTNEILNADVAIQDGIIVGVGEYSGEKEFDLNGKYVCSGFIDAHLHLESTLVNPAQLIYCAGTQGTTTFIVDPHEAANVSGKAGIDYILDQTAKCQANVFVMMPSCVPSAPFEDNGCRMDAEDMKPYLTNPRILGLGEVMDCPAVLRADEAMLNKLDLFRSKIIDGHAGYLGERETGCYALSGIQTDHECCSFEAAQREMRTGMQVLIREGTAAKNLEAIIKGVVKNNFPCHKLSFCTDDKHIEEILKNGHISYNVRKAISLGLDPVEAIKIATIYTANCYGLKNFGAVAPGYRADLLILSDLENVQIDSVLYNGKPLEKPDFDKAESTPSELLHTVHVKLSGEADFCLPLQRDSAVILEVVPREILTGKTIDKVTVRDGFFVADETYQKIAVLERHHETGKKGLGIVKGFCIRGGAIASTVGHDSHNLIVIGDNDADMYRAVKELKDCGGGYTVVQNGKDPLTLKLEVMGLISRESYEVVQEKLSAMLKKAREMGVPETIDPFITLSFLALPVIPKLRVTTRGLYDVLEEKFVDVNA